MTSDEFDAVPLTPSHLLYGRRIQSLPDAQPKTDKDFNSSEFITRRMRYVAVLIGHFWKRFNKYHLLFLLEFHNLTIKGCSFDLISKGTVLSVQEDTQPRGSWKLGEGLFTPSVLRIRFLLIPKNGSCEHIKNDLPSNRSLILKKKPDGNRTCSIFIRHSP